MATLARIRCSPLWLAIALLLLLQQRQPACEARYLPTRSHGDELDKLRELMLQILESSNEEPQPQSLRAPNEATGGNGFGPQRQPGSSWLSKLGAAGPLEAAVEGAQRRPFVASGPRGVYDGARYY